MPQNTFPTSTLGLSSLQDGDTPSLLDIRPRLEVAARDMSDEMVNVFLDIQNAFDSIQETLRSVSPSLEYLQIDSADIESLYVGSEFGPGSMTVASGPPNYDTVGWIGSAEAAPAVNITSIVAGLVTTAAVHKLKAGHTVLIEGTTSAATHGYWVVDTVPTTDTFTATSLTGSSTGGTMTLIFAGGWLKTLAVSGTSFSNAHLVADVDGALYITDAFISLTGSSSTITLDPTVGSLKVEQAGGGYLAELSSGWIRLTDGTNVGDESVIQPGFYRAYKKGLSSLALARVVDIYGYGAFGPIVSLSQANGTPTATTATLLNDVLGGLMLWGFEGAGESEYCAGIFGVATEDHDTGAHGAGLSFSITANGATTPTAGMVLNQDGSLNVATSYKVAGTQVVGAGKTGWALPTGTLARTTFDQSTVTLAELAKRVAALVTDLYSQHGLIKA